MSSCISPKLLQLTDTCSLYGTLCTVYNHSNMGNRQIDDDFIILGSRSNYLFVPTVPTRLYGLMLRSDLFAKRNAVDPILHIT